MRGYPTLDYASVRNLVQNSSDKTSIRMLPGLGIKSRGSFIKKSEERGEQLIEEPRLLTTAKARIQ
jgi:hypothetical protein